MASPRWMMVLLLALGFAGKSVGQDVSLDDFVIEILQADAVPDTEPDQAVQVLQAEPAQVEAALQAILQEKAKQADLAARKAKWTAQIADAKRNVEVKAAQLNELTALAEAGKVENEKVELAQNELEVVKKKIAVLKQAEPKSDNAKAEEEKADEVADAASEDGDDDSAENKNAKPAVDPRSIKLQMSDGTIIKGKLETSTIEIETRFGTLEVPIKKIRYFRPGLNSKPNRKAEFEELVHKLGSDDASQRKAASDAIKKLGQPIKPLLMPYAADANATRVKETRAIIDWLGEQNDFDEFSLDTEKMVRMEDTIATTEFTMTGRIVQQSFKLASDFGDLEMSIKDIVMGERETGETEVIRKAFSIDQANLCARGFKTVGLRVEKGDKISIMASGTIGMTRWGSNAVATPEGAPNYGWYINGKIANGALCAKIGSNTVFKVGSKLKMVAKQSGTLQFGIGVTDRYAKSTSYRWPGSFKVKVQIERD